MIAGFPIFHGRPVFNLPLNWDERPARGILADARPQQIGFGAEVLEPLQEFTSQDFVVTAYLKDACVMNAFERFFALTYGPLRGFWLPGVEVATNLIQVADQQNFVAAPNSKLAAFAADTRWQYLWFVPPPGSGLPSQPAQISGAVADPAGSGGDLLTLVAPLDTLPTTDWAIYRLHYVRLGTNDLKLTFWGDSQARCQVQFTELPPEYTAIELGERPAYLYTFTRAAGEMVPPKVWHLTSFDQKLVIGGTTYLPAPLSHGKLQNTQKGDRDGISLQGWLDGSDNPLALYVPFPPQLRVRVQVDSVRLDALDGEIAGVSGAPTRVFSGEVTTVVPRGRSLQATCVSRLDSLSAQLPRFFIQKLCNHQLYNPATCKVDKTAYRVTGILSQNSGGAVLVTITGGTSDRPDHWFAQGWIVVCTGENEELRSVADSIRQSDNTQIVYLNSGFSAAVVAGQQFVAYAGCDLTAISCGPGKFNNFANFGGHPCLQNDLGLKTIDVASSGGGKGGSGGGK